MNALDHSRDLLTHMEWADATMWSCLHSCREAQEEERLRGLLHHLHGAQRAFLQVLKAEPVELPKPEDFAELVALEKWAREYYEILANYMETLKAESLQEKADVPWASGFEEKFGQPPTDLTRADVLTQIAMHSAHHRAQVCSYIRGLEAEPPTVDYILWAWLGKPAPDWLP